MDIENIFQNAVIDRIAEFNKSRNHHKELKPQFLTFEELGRVRKFGRTITLDANTSEGVILECINKLADATVRTMLKRKPRPAKVFIKLTFTSLLEKNQRRLFARLWIPI